MQRSEKTRSKRVQQQFANDLFSFLTAFLGGQRGAAGLRVFRGQEILEDHEKKSKDDYSNENPRGLAFVPDEKRFRVVKKRVAELGAHGFRHDP